MQHVKRHYAPLRLAEAMARLDAGEPLPPGALVVTFDDGYDDNYRVAYPILRELGVPATFFVSTGYIDSGLPYHYDWFVHLLSVATVAAIDLPELGHAAPLPAGLRARQRLAQDLISKLKALDDDAQIQVIDRLARACGMPRVAPVADCRPMSWEQLREMHAGGMEIGSHGVGHRMLAKLDDAALEAEIVGSRDAIGRALGTLARVISYPVGGADAWDGRVVSAARAAGYVAGCSYLAGSNDPRRMDRYGLRRVPVERTTRLDVFRAMTAVPEWFGYASRAPRQAAGHGQVAAGRSPAAASVR
jgi:peptidoglycan/xylan/chitin deacetylase (PgdA/CDA1 family)